jgi:hypothetical protein
MCHCLAYTCGLGMPPALSTRPIFASHPRISAQMPTCLSAELNRVHYLVLTSFCSKNPTRL